MSGLRHINDVLDVNWNKFSRDYPGLFYTNENGTKSMPLIVPASVLRDDHAPLYLRRLVDQDPTSYYMLIAADPTKGPVDRDTAVEFFHDLFYKNLHMASSYDRRSGIRPTAENPEFGTMDEFGACNKEVLPAADDAAFQRHYDEVVNGVTEPTPEEIEAARQERIEKLGFDPDDGNTLDIDDNGDVVGSAAAKAKPTKTNVGNDFSLTVGGHQYSISFLNKICYAVDFHVNVGMELGYDGGRHNVGSRGSYRRLREDDVPEAEKPEKVDSEKTGEVVAESASNGGLTPIEIGQKIRDGLLRLGPNDRDLSKINIAATFVDVNGKKLDGLSEYQTDIGLGFGRGILAFHVSLAGSDTELHLAQTSSVAQMVELLRTKKRAFHPIPGQPDILELDDVQVCISGETADSYKMKMKYQPYDFVLVDVAVMQVNSGTSLVLTCKATKDAAEDSFKRDIEFFEEEKTAETPALTADESEQDQLNESFGESQIAYWNSLISG